LGRRQFWEEGHTQSVNERPRRQLLNEVGDARCGVTITEA
jgi:hypothetical protein